MNGKGVKDVQGLSSRGSTCARDPWETPTSTLRPAQRKNFLKEFFGRWGGAKKLNPLAKGFFDKMEGVCFLVRNHLFFDRHLIAQHPIRFPVSFGLPFPPSFSKKTRLQ